MTRLSPAVVFPALVALVLASLVTGVAVGPVSIPFSDSVRVLSAQIPGLDVGSVPTHFRTIIMKLRLPRVLAGFFVGGSLAVSGTVMQGLFRNPLATPYILGVASGGSAGAALVILLGFGGALFLPLGALVGSATVVALVYRLGQGEGGLSSYTLILAGVALSALFSALTTFFIYLADPHQRQRILFWLMGGLWRSNWSMVKVLAPVSVGGVTLLRLWARDLNALSLGDDAASHLGVSPETVKKVLLMLATLITSVSVAVAGSISFVGLVVPHILRLVIGPDHRRLLLASALAGGSLLVYADVIAKMVFQPSELPVGVLTAFCGAPFFLYLLRRKIGQGRLQ